jgi:hypothetical protein
MKIQKIQPCTRAFTNSRNQNRKSPVPNDSVQTAIPNKSTTSQSLPKSEAPKSSHNGKKSARPNFEKSQKPTPLEKSIPEKDPQLGPTTFEEVAERAGIAKPKPSPDIQGVESFLTPQTQMMLDNYSSLIKNGLAMQVGQQMYVKLYQTGLDTFLMAEKWKYEQFTTILQFSQTVAQMMVGSMLTMRTQWEKMWTQVRQQQGQIHDALIKLYTQP